METITSLINIIPTLTSLDGVYVAFLLGFLAGWGLLPRPTWIEPYLASLQSVVASVLKAIGLKWEPKLLQKYRKTPPK